MKQPKYIKSPLNYTGNKYRLLDKIIPMFPKNINTFADIFGGSGTVLFNTQAKHYIYNERAKYVFDIINGLLTTDYDHIISRIEHFIQEYSLTKTNESGYKQLRDDYNNINNNPIEGEKEHWIMLYVLCSYAFNSQGRFNSEGKFNMPFGKRRFSEVQKQNILNLKSQLNGKDILLLNKDFESIDYSLFKPNDFVYFDPPYLGSITTYNEKNGWTQYQEDKLEQILNTLNSNGINFALSNNLKYQNKTLERLCSKYTVYHLGSQYNNSFYNKRDKQSQDDEVLITNYNQNNTMITNQNLSSSTTYTQLSLF